MSVGELRGGPESDIFFSSTSPFHTTKTRRRLRNTMSSCSSLRNGLRACAFAKRKVLTSRRSSASASRTRFASRLLEDQKWKKYRDSSWSDRSSATFRYSRRACFSRVRNRSSSSWVRRACSRVDVPAAICFTSFASDAQPLNAFRMSACLRRSSIASIRKFANCSSVRSSLVLFAAADQRVSMAREICGPSGWMLVKRRYLPLPSPIRAAHRHSEKEWHNSCFRSTCSTQNAFRLRKAALLQTDCCFHPQRTSRLRRRNFASASNAFRTGASVRIRHSAKTRSTLSHTRTQ
mmetsp:Transcript_27550/g.69463  ORF Transcript_27550/g.69463 Transcript_27550/m.69463 type:complete len:292 (+) Transcript_27550:1011-1886(+)